MLTPRNKVDFYNRYLKSEFGNRPRTWSTWPQLRDSDYLGNVTIRDLIPGGPCHYGISSVDLREGNLPNNLDINKVRFNESMPDDRLVIQGNVTIDEHGLLLEYSRLPNIGHRDAVRQPNLQQARGLLATSLLNTLLFPTSHDDLKELLEEYRDAIIEFSSYSIPVGLLPHRNTVFWEVRNY